MANIDQLEARVNQLTKRHQTASARQLKLQGILEEKKGELRRLKEEIIAAGFDPKTLREDRTRLEAELEDLMNKFENELTVVERAQEEYEK